MSLSWLRDRFLDGFIVVERAIRRTPLDRPVRFIYRRTIKSKLNPTGFQRINVDDDRFPPFGLYFPEDGQGLGKRTRLQGKYEPHVMEALDEYVGTNTIFWEVGAQWGYFSMAVGGRAQRVVSFEQDPQMAALIQKSAERNNRDNHSTVVGTVGDDIHLDDFPSPDVVLMDIEGWELSVLERADETLSRHPVLIVEVHEPSMLGPDAPDNDPQRIVQHLLHAGYELERIGANSDENYHILATEAK